MACEVPNITLEELRAEIFKKRALIRPVPNQSAELSRHYLDSIRDLFTIIKIPWKDLPKEVQYNIIADPDELVERYGLKDTGELLLNKRITDAVTHKFISQRGRQSVEDITRLPDTVIKAKTGTKIHQSMQDIMEHLIEASDSPNIVKNSSVPRYKANIKSLESIQKEADLPDKYFWPLVEYQKNSLKDVLELQQKIDPEGKVRIFTEQVLYDELQDVGGTADFIAHFSDNSYGHLDYKTMHASDHYTRKTPSGDREIVDPDWIPFYKYQDFNIQLPMVNSILENKFGFGQNRFTRVVPIQVDYNRKSGYHPKGKQLMDSLKQVTIETVGSKASNRVLGQIPIQEKTGIEDLDRQIKKLIDIKNNQQIEIEKTKESTKKQQLAVDIARKQRLINKLIAQKDLRLLKYELRIILGRYIKDGKLFDIDSPTINNEVNPNYVATSEMSDLLQEFRAYRDIIGASRYHMLEMGIPESELTEYKQEIQGLANDLDLVINTVETAYHNRAMTSEERMSIKDSRMLTFWDKFFMSPSEQEHPVFKVFVRYLHKAQNKRRIESQKLFKQLREQSLILEKYGKEHGKSKSQVYDMMIDNKTGNLYNKHNSKFYDDLAKAQESNNKVWLDKHLILKKDAVDRRNALKKAFDVKSPTKEEQESWARKHSFPSARRNPSMWYIYFEIRDEVESEYYSDGYNNLLRPENKPVLAFWQFYRDKMLEAAELLDMRGQVRSTFIPWLRANTLEQVFQDKWNWENVKESVSSIIGVKEDETMFGDPYIQGKIDPQTGEEKLSIPRHYINPLKDNYGRTNIGLKSRDLEKSLFIFYDMALNYNYLNNEVEPYVDALKDIIKAEGVKPKKKYGKDVKEKSGFLSRITGSKVDVAEAFDMMVKYHLYGVKIQDNLSKETIKFWNNLKTYQTYKELMFSPLVWAGNKIQITGNVFFTGKAGYFYTNKDQIDTMKMKNGLNGKEGKELYHSLVYFFEPSVSKKQVMLKELTSRKSLQLMSMDTAFWGFRKAEEQMSHDILVNVLKNYAFDKDGDMTRLKNLPVGTKSLFEQSKVVKDNLVIEGVIDKDGNVDIDKYTKIRDMAIAVAKQISGQMNPEDMANYSSVLMYNMVMSFKSWLPGMWNARGGRMRYNASTNSVIEGKYQVLLQDMDKGNKKMLAFIGLEVIPRLAKFIALSPFIAVSNKNLYQINESRARDLFEKFKSDNHNDPKIQKMTFEDFFDYKQGQLRSLAAELTVIFAFMSILAALGLDWDDDGKADYTQTWAGRTIFRIFNRGRRELSFFINPNDWYQVLRTPIPVTGLAMDSLAWLRNVRDESGDVIFGLDERTGMWKVMFGSNRGKDEKPVFFETISFLPGHKLIKMVDLFESYEKATI